LLNRRNVLAGACAICAFAGRAKAETPYHGCVVNAAEMGEWVELRELPGSYGVTLASVEPEVGVTLASVEPEVKYGSGDPTFDRALAVTPLKMSEQLSVLPGFVFSERVYLNAFASPNKALGREDGSVVFGKSLYRDIMSRPEHPEVGIVAVCAHEFGHIAQFKFGIRKDLVVDKRVKRLELHADFISGYFAGRRKLETPDFPAAVFATTLYSEGDSDYGSPDHHGTSRERGEAVVAGFDSAYRAHESFGEALETGVRYVKRIPL
jgi:hypothetical protein